MMNPKMHALTYHPAHPPSLPMTVEADVQGQNDADWLFTFRCRYEVDARRSVVVRLPELVVAQARDGLWQHTCCEAFMGRADASDYVELNFSPSSAWAVYRFSDYRVRDASFECTCAPRIEVTRQDDGFELSARLSPAEFLLDGLAHPTALIQLSAVIETTDGQKSYWSLAHADPYKPDFHARAGFLLPVQL